MATIEHTGGESMTITDGERNVLGEKAVRIFWFDPARRRTGRASR
jgi:hypothetical protein